jgi:2-phospho-L-lactate transferase/gluconeogenesis factor (CofD/UPF0052 family)
MPNEPESEKLRAVVFSGGRGTTSIADALLRHPQIDLTLVVNAYDDGLSTGRVRAFVPGMLGPSDVRKCCTRMMADDSAPARALRDLIELRLPAGLSSSAGLALLEKLAAADTRGVEPAIADLLDRVPLGQARALASYLGAFLAHARAAETPFDFGDCALGNLVFAGCFLSRGRSFNEAVAAFATLTSPKGHILNVTSGENLVLVGLKEDGTILGDEAALVSPQSRVPVRDIYLLRDYLTPIELEELAALSPDETHDYLDARSIFPRINPECARAIADADIIIYGPGTQHSSLYPSYLTQGVAEAIRANTEADKVFVANIRLDHEIQGQTAESLVKKLVYYMQRKQRLLVTLDDVATTFFINTATGDGRPRESLLPSAVSRLPVLPAVVVRANWEAQRGEHLGGRVVDEVIALANLRAQRKLAQHHYMISIVVPCLDEARTVHAVLKDLSLLDTTSLGLGKEIIYVDGGSTDGSFELAQSVRGVRCLRTKGPSGRGAALRTGIEAASGDVVIFFPSDGEYSPTDIARLVEPIVRDQFKAVFGSRGVRVPNLSAHMHRIYPEDSFGYLMGKYGGMVLSAVALFEHNRFVGDPLTGLKAFDRRLLRSLSLESVGLEIESEIIARLAASGEPILEIPIEFHPRGRSEGKKTSLMDGLRALEVLVRFKQRKAT